MTEGDATRMGEQLATITVLAWLIAHDERVSLDALSGLAIALMSPGREALEVIPEHLQDDFRVAARDFVQNAHKLASAMRRQNL